MNRFLAFVFLTLFIGLGFFSVITVLTSGVTPQVKTAEAASTSAPEPAPIVEEVEAPKEDPIDAILKDCDLEERILVTTIVRNAPNADRTKLAALLIEFEKTCTDAYPNANSFPLERIATPATLRANAEALGYDVSKARTLDRLLSSLLSGPQS